MKRKVWRFLECYGLAMGWLCFYTAMWQSHLSDLSDAHQNFHLGEIGQNNSGEFWEVSGLFHSK